MVRLPLSTSIYQVSLLTCFRPTKFRVTPVLVRYLLVPMAGNLSVVMFLLTHLPLVFFCARAEAKNVWQRFKTPLVWHMLHLSDSFLIS